MLHMTRRHGCAYASYFLRPALTPQHHITSFHLVAVQLISSYLILTHFISSYLILSHVTSAYLIFFHLISVDPILSHLISNEHANGRASEHASNTWANERANNRTSKQRMRERTSKRMVECATNQVAKWFVAILVQVFTSFVFFNNPVGHDGRPWRVEADRNLHRGDRAVQMVGFVFWPQRPLEIWSFCRVPGILRRRRRRLIQAQALALLRWRFLNQHKIN